VVTDISMELDHVLVCCSVGGGEGEALRRAGLSEGSPNTHPGQGTACRRFFFSNAYLELLWVNDEEEARSAVVAPTRLWERWTGRGSGACPFALVLRSGGDASEAPPFPSWPYRPPYLPEGLAIRVAADTPLEGPEIFYMGFQRGMARAGEEPVEHPLGCRRLTGVTLHRPPGGRSATANLLEATGLVSFRDADESLLELCFDAADRGLSDFRPELPLVMRW
jgi:hypothetical protein